MSQGILAALTVPLEREDGYGHRRELAQALRQLAAQIPRTGQAQPSASTTVTGTSYASVTGSPWTIGPRNVEQALDVDVQLQLEVNGSTVHPLYLALQVGGVQVAEWIVQPQRAFLLTPHPVPLARYTVSFFVPSQTVGRGSRDIDLQAKTDSGGSWTITADSIMRWTLR